MFDLIKEPKISYKMNKIIEDMYKYKFGKNWKQILQQEINQDIEQK